MMTSPTVIPSRKMFKEPHGIFEYLLICVKYMSSGVTTNRKMHGDQTKTVSRKHGVKSGSSVFHVRFESYEDCRVEHTF